MEDIAKYELQKEQRDYAEEQLEVLQRIEIAINATRGNTLFIFWNTVLMGIITMFLMWITFNI